LDKVHKVAKKNILGKSVQYWEHDLRYTSFKGLKMNRFVMAQGWYMKQQPAENNYETAI
jgi:hypothetical protein